MCCTLLLLYHIISLHNEYWLLVNFEWNYVSHQRKLQVEIKRLAGWCWQMCLEYQFSSFSLVSLHISGAVIPEQSDSFLSLHQDDNVWGKLCWKTKGHGQETQSPTVPVSQLSETRRATKEWQVHSVGCQASHASGRRTSQPLQTVQVEEVWFEATLWEQACLQN